MKYTSFSPNNERFGFFAKGNFKCAYENERLGAIGICVLIGIAVLLILNQIMGFFTLFDSNGALKGGMFDVEKGKVSSGFVEFAMSALSSAFFILIGIIAAAIIFMLVVLLKGGRTYQYTANENEFVVTYPDGHKLTLVYEEVISITTNERRFIFNASGMDIVVWTKSDTHVFRYIHTPYSKLNGISDTPFNFIKERIGLTKKPHFSNLEY